MRGNEFDCTKGNFDDETEIDSYVVPGGEGCDGFVRTAPVGSFPGGASWCGAEDMAGTPAPRRNATRCGAGDVREWTADWYGSYSSESQTNPTGPASGDSRVLRGGSWYNRSFSGRAANRIWDLPSFRDSNNGFRCASAIRSL